MSGSAKGLNRQQMADRIALEFQDGWIVNLGVGTELAEGRETRVINGREYLLEYALPLDYAFIRATRADTSGNLQFHRSQRNFCPVMATAARIAIAEVDEDIVPAGAIDPDQVHTPGIFVHRVVKVPPAPEGLWPARRQERRR